MKGFWSTAFPLLLIVIGVAFDKGIWTIPREWNPFAPLVVSDPLTPVTQWKLGRLKDDREACRAVLDSAPAGTLDYTPLADYTPVAGCPLVNVLRVRGGEVAFNASFVASCPLAVAWVLFERHRLQPAAEARFGARVAAVQHYGSFACRNIYHRENARRSEHATAEALDVAAFRLADGRRISVLDDWGDDDAADEFLREVQAGACGLFGTVLGPEYNAAHANHFHLGMRGMSFCR
ncbi:extensin family protein [Halomonas sp. HP20-15]|uniref:extensin-like domain-containing protein n=1 Tax=Halomonas sp. HP20-15 TaxID=3085901 RepID=UPI002980F3E1|nr:extensin family protein [Halomonas sp. HP20-15]MDW5378788.1 extensin family protein [Halomonas sp. HP20-15]